jgi:hypothetical protein
MLIYAIIGTFVLLMFVGFSYFDEKREWNYGYCIKHGRTWKYFCTNSQGGRGYKCENQWAFSEPDKHGRQYSLTCSRWFSWGVDESI